MNTTTDQTITERLRREHAELVGLLTEIVKTDELAILELRSMGVQPTAMNLRLTMRGRALLNRITAGA